MTATDSTKWRTALIHRQADFTKLTEAELDALPPVDVCVHMAALTSPGNGTEAQLEVNVVGARGCTHALPHMPRGSSGAARVAPFTSYTIPFGHDML